MEAKSTDRKSFQLTGDGEQLGELKYENLFLLKAEIRLQNGELYQIRPMGIFGTAISVAKDGAEMASLKVNWHGHIVFAFGDGREFILKARGTFHNRYLLENKEGEMLIQFEPQFNWNQFNYNYAITYNKKPQDVVLVLLGVYASNYYIAVMSGAFGGIG